jgi:PAS domain S-box-containing protein
VIAVTSGDQSFDAFYDDAPCGFLTTTVDGTIGSANRTLLSWIGVDASELVGVRRFQDLLPPGAKIYYETHYAPLLQMQGRVRAIALELVRSDASRLPVLVSATLKCDASGLPLCVFVTIFDASDRRDYERELLRARSEAEERAAAATALAHVTEGVVLVDDDQRIRLLNPAAERILGTTADRAQGLPLASIAPDWPAVGEGIPIAAPEQLPHAVVIPLTLPHGARWLSTAGQSAPEGTVYTLRDVTDERRLEHLRDDIVAIVSHELRTPLAGLHGAAQTLISLGDRLDEERRSELIEMIGQQSTRLTRVVEQILLTEKLDKSGISADRLCFDLNGAVDRIVAGAEAWPSSRSIRVSAVDRVSAEGDPALVEQIVINLLDNACKYSPPDTEIRIDIERFRANARVAVSNSGPRIPLDARSRIFEKFYRLDAQQASGTAGTGLGLYIARELATRMHGNVSLLDTTGDSHTTFVLDLPLARNTPNS